MSFSMMKEAVRISDRFYGVRDAETIERQGRFRNAILLVFISHMLLIVAFIKFKDFDLAHPRIIKDVNVTFEFIPPPPPPRQKVEGQSDSNFLSGFGNPNAGSESAPTPLNAPELSTPTLKALIANPTPTMPEARPIPSRRMTVAPPLSVAPTNAIKTNAGLGEQTPKQVAMQPPNQALIGPQTMVQQLPGALVQGGAPDSNQGGIGIGGQGQGGTGTGQGDLGAGQGPGIATRLPSGATTARGNIGPYKKDMFLRLGRNWHPKKSYENLIVLITLNHDGHLVSSEIFQSSGEKKADKQALQAVESTSFAPLPDWYKGETLTFKIQLTKVEASNQ